MIDEHAIPQLPILWLIGERRICRKDGIESVD